MRNQTRQIHLMIFFRDCDGYYEVTMFDEIGMNCDIEVESASDFMAMLVSVRLVGYEFIEDKNK